MTDVNELKKLVLRYGFAGAAELDEALAALPPGGDPLRRLVESGLLNERQAEVLARRLAAASAPAVETETGEMRAAQPVEMETGEVPPAPEPVEPEPIELDTGEVAPRPPRGPVPPRRPRRRPRRRPPVPEEVVPEPEPLPDDDELRGYPFGEILLRLKLVDEDTLGGALAAQEAAVALGRREFLGSILLRREAITAGELLRVLKIQGKRILRCSTCDLHANMTPSGDGPAPRRVCPACFGSLREAAEDDLFLDRFPPQIELDDQGPNPLSGVEFKDIVVESLYMRTHSASVHIGLQSVLGRKVALSVLEEDLARRPEMRELFLERARAAARLNFPGIAAGIDIGEIEDRPCYVFELPEGHSLEEFVALRGPMPPKSAVAVVLHAGEVLAQCHRHGVFSGSLAPEQVFVGAGLRPTLLGVGFDVPARTSAGTPLPPGNPAWTAPELFLGEHPDARSDVFVLGALLYFALTGKAPMRGRNWADLLAGRLYLDPQPVETLAERLPHKLPALVASMMERDPEARPEPFDEVLSSLAALAGESYAAPVEPDEPEVPRPISRSRPVRRPGRRRRY